MEKELGYMQKKEQRLKDREYVRGLEKKKGENAKKIEDIKKEIY